MELFKIFGTIGLKGVNDTKKDLNDVTDSAEKSSSKMSKFGGIMKGIGKAVLATTVAVGGGAVALVKQVSGAYGQLQQSIGGIETLFGKSADKVIQNANNAFTTAGISANDYMQQVTSFSASLLQALGGDTEKACDSADMAIRDMADNANKMGTSMEMIQNAYQGFSKQNYTMLDNLKLGYGGTKTEMERLLKDAQKITGIKYDISNLNDVYQAIHVIQGELGITGTTAKEAGATIEGSFNSLGASWQNFLAGLGNPDADMKQLVDNLAKGISGAVNNVIPVINNMVAVLPTVMDALINAISSMLPTLIQTFTELVTKVIDAIVQLLPQFIPLAIDCVLTVAQALIENLPLIVEAGIQLILGLAQGISDALPQLVPIIIMVIEEILNILINNIYLIIEIGVQLLVGLIEGITSAVPLLVDMIPRVVQAIISTIISNFPLMIKCGMQILGALINGIIAYIPNLIEYIPSLISAIVNGLLDGLSQIFGVGENLVGDKGLLGGIKKAFNKVIDFFKNNWQGILLFLVNPFWGAFKLIYDNCEGFRNFFNKIVDSIKKLWSNFTGWLRSAFKLPKFKIEGSLNPINWIKSGLPKIGVEWYAEGGVMTRPTVFGMNPSNGNAMVGGEAGNEAIAPISTLQSYVSDAVRKETGDLAYGMNKLIELLSTYLPDIKEKMDRPLVLDSGELVSGITEKMDNALGNRSNIKARFGV